MRAQVIAALFLSHQLLVKELLLLYSHVRCALLVGRYLRLTHLLLSQTCLVLDQHSLALHVLRLRVHLLRHKERGLILDKQWLLGIHLQSQLRVTQGRWRFALRA